ncbi:MAG: hypothetical protein DRG78_18995 [Epsilonproteobacteria bacterium]|nr:MAG: hypothetical protein DRG78_18995 [Campylobacterota bacterium]
MYTIKKSLLYIINLYYQILFNLIPKKSKLLIYTDSRGFLVNCLTCNKTPKESYIQKLSKNYNIDFQICPHKHTTLLDFLEFVENKDLSMYSNIIIHLGIVDFSPRPISQKNMVFTKKRHIADKLFPNSHMSIKYYSEQYENETTFSLYDIHFFNEFIIPKIDSISKKVDIIWLGLNSVDLTWRGNYFKDRPQNINEILTYQNSILDTLCKLNSSVKYININELNNFNAREHTLDNMHLSKRGFNFFYNLLIKELSK